MGKDDGVIGLPGSVGALHLFVKTPAAGAVGMLLDPRQAMLDLAKDQMVRECLVKGLKAETEPSLMTMARDTKSLTASYVVGVRRANWLEQISETIRMAVSYKPPETPSGLIVQRH